MSDVAKMILDNLRDDVTDPKSHKSIIAQKLISQAKEKEKKLTKLSKEAEEAIHDAEVDIKIRKCRELENKRDLIWMDYASWNALNPHVKGKIATVLDPLYWSGIYFSYSEFCNKYEQVLADLDNSTAVYILTCGLNYQIMAFPSDYSIFDWMGINQLKEMQKDFRTRVLKGFGILEKKLTVKEFKCPTY